MTHDDLQKKLARRHAEEQLDLFDIDEYIASHPTLVGGYPPDPVSDALLGASDWDAVIDELWEAVEDAE